MNAAQLVVAVRAVEFHVVGAVMVSAVTRSYLPGLARAV